MTPQKNNQKKSFLPLPQKIEDFLASFELSRAIGNISAKYGFLEEIKDKAGILKPEETSKLRWAKLVKVVQKVLEGELPLGNFKEVLQKELNVDSEVAEQITQDVKEQIFSKVEKSLQKLYKIKERMMPGYSKEQVWKIYEKLPEELKKVIFSEETAENISAICKKNNIQEEKKVSEISRLVGEVLMGLLPPNEFQNNLEKELKLSPEIAKKISFGAYRFIFFPIRETLGALYETEISLPGAPIKAKTVEKLKEEPKKKDVYREPLE